jgi:alpha-glucosidase
MEIAAFQPIDRDHTEIGSGNQEPWVGGPAQEAIRRRFIEARYRLLPYLYTLADEASRTGLPVVRPLFLEYPDAAPDKHPLDIDLPASGEFLLGHDLLVAPAPFSEAEDSYSVEFPSHEWYDYWTGAKVEAPRNAAQGPEVLGPASDVFSIRVKPELATLPVFVHAGSILPTAPLVQSTNQTPQGPLTLKVYAGDNCAGSLYQDDGRTYAYEHGAYLRERFTCRVTPQGLEVTMAPQDGLYPAWWKTIRVEIYGWKPTAKKAALDGRSMQNAIQPITNGIAVTVPENPKGFALELQ